METTECQFDTIMKQFFHITFAMVTMILMLSMGTTAFAQDIADETPSIEVSYDQAIFEAFQTYLAATDTLPTTDEKNRLFVDGFFSQYKDDFGLIVIKKDDGSEASPQEVDELFQRCITLLEEEEATIITVQNLNQENEDSSFLKNLSSLEVRQLAIRVGVIGILVLILITIVVLWAKAKKKKKPVADNDMYATDTNPSNSGNNEASNDVIIRKKTSSVLNKQSLEDVVNNSNYLAINCADFCTDSAVKTMYIKNTCIIDIYNMYAEDLRNPDNPKEDGCMVLGRWVHDEQYDEYVVSLEEIVFPGDDAVFAEYELDFGGKIKVKVNEKLRKLRRETNLQYDLTCWVHSHPGLGVFFSNTDSNLHLIHKHPSHPKFLTAIVIDILTPQQELGVFTFKHDMGINSKADLTRLYSLEEWYKWAIGSRRNSVAIEEHYNTLDKAKSRNKGCYNIQLSNSTIIDVDLIATSQNHEGLYFVHGFTMQQMDQTSIIAVKIDNAETIVDNELIGCFMVVTHRSYPTIKKEVANYLGRIGFVMVYSVSDGILTTIPVVDNDLCADESYYGEQPLEELKIWTRRKR